MKAWITKYALSKGVYVIDAAESEHYPGMINDRADSWAQPFHGEGREWHRAREGAIARAEEMRAAKITSLRKQIAKLEALTFEDAP